MAPKVLIIGAGFGGVYAARRLLPLVRRGEIDLAVVNKTNYFLFTPLLHEVATGGLSAQSVAEPLREIFAGTPVWIGQATVESIDFANRTVRLNGEQLIYDYLIIATGADTADYGIKGVKAYAFGLKNLAEALRIKERVIDLLEQAVLRQDCAGCSELRRLAVVGGGPTGVELAAELAEFVSAIVKRYLAASGRAVDFEICLVSAAASLLPDLPLFLRQSALKRLEQKGVKIYLGKKVSEVIKSGLRFSDGALLETAMVIWVAGVQAVSPKLAGTPLPTQGRLPVDAFFRVIGQDKVFALGDVAVYPDATGRPLPMLAQAAVAEAKVVAQNIIAAVRSKPLQRLGYRQKGILVSVGSWFAVGEIFSFPIRGRFAWWLWRTIYLFKFASWKKRIRIAFEWTLNLFYPRDITKPN